MAWPSFRGYNSNLSFSRWADASTFGLGLGFPAGVYVGPCCFGVGASIPFYSSQYPNHEGGKSDHHFFALIGVTYSRGIWQEWKVVACNINFKIPSKHPNSFFCVVPVSLGPDSVLRHEGLPASIWILPRACGARVQGPRTVETGQHEPLGPRFCIGSRCTIGTTERSLNLGSSLLNADSNQQAH